MLTNIQIKNFKCFENLDVEVKPLTVLSGVNGMGKSTFIQSLLLLRQSVLEAQAEKGALLNGSLVRLGYSDDVLYEQAKDDESIEFTLNTSSYSSAFSFAYGKNEKFLSHINRWPETAGFSIFSDDFYYLAAERIGPRTAFSSLESGHSRLNHIGNTGEYCAWLLASLEREPTGSSKLLHESCDLDELRLQVEAWLTEIGQMPRIHLLEHPAMEQVSMQFSFLRDGVPSNHYRPTNVGFGLTYALPIFVAALAVKPGGTLLIENPEAHLHPKGQLAMGKFLAQVAASGVQVFVETHSDHLLNGIRIATKRKQISPSDVSLLFFCREKDTQSTTVKTPKLDADGRLDQWPEGFFDEWENGLAELL